MRESIKRSYLEKVKSIQIDDTKVVLDKDSAKKFQSPIRGKEIMEIFKINEGKQVGIFKKAVEEAILEGTIENTYNAAKRFLLDQKNEKLD